MGSPKIVVLTAPSGAGKTTIAHRVIAEIPALQFSVSATTRPQREGEVDGVHYYFVSKADFQQLIEDGCFVEYEEVYPGRFYGTLRSEIDRLAEVHPVLLDIDVKGALNVKRLYGDAALTIFIQPPSLAVLEARLRRRGTETAVTLQDRLARARLELEYADRFDAIVVNDDLDAAVGATLRLLRPFLKPC